MTAQSGFNKLNKENLSPTALPDINKKKFVFSAANGFGPNYMNTNSMDNIPEVEESKNAMRHRSDAMYNRPPMAHLYQIN
jgi:hypothetical protein